MIRSGRYQLNDKKVTSKIIDGEAIIINLANGMYYSLDKTGAVAWLLISGGHSVDNSAELLSTRFAVPTDRVREDLEQLVGDLLIHDLLLPAEDGAVEMEIVLAPSTSDPYVTPVLHSYDDMGNVLALDPPLPQLEIENEISFRPAALGFGAADDSRDA